ncbi:MULTISPECIES: DUF1874 domain-containing protein [Caldimonas]|jgi:hypothetical protein|uniref:STIV orfB116 family protein n=1 Tax=Caldimonas TaxID=196013 RepID=UPI000780D050|nr:DUF1874 domain-containing protein [Caldimonas taiwanensis]MCX7659419.1 YddF family protein [Caldimonas manganoxidans]GIX24250.1 MAG: hypothetical protein KatS3mg122_1481 [Caldimonas sp.]
MNRYLLNSPVLTDFGHWHYIGPLSVEQARAFASAGPWQSAIGHAETARFLSQALGMEVPCARIAVHMQPGDEALVLRLLMRLPEGHVLDADALARLPHSYGLLRRLD